MICDGGLSTVRPITDHRPPTTEATATFMLCSYGWESPMTRNITLAINGKKRTDTVEPRMLLIHYLRETAGLTGPHIACETSLCGACTVHLDGKAIKSCSMFAVQADGRD